MDRWRAFTLVLTEAERLFPNNKLETGKQKSVWVHKAHKRSERVRQLCLDDGWFKTYFRMSLGQFDSLLLIIRPSITKLTTNYH